jgi:hypothetical protein
LKPHKGLIKLVDLKKDPKSIKNAQKWLESAVNSVKYWKKQSKIGLKKPEGSLKVSKFDLNYLR